MDEIVTLAEAAEILGLAPSTLRNQLKAGRLTGRLIGKTYVVLKSEVERYRRENIAQVGRPAVPHIFATIQWPDGAYETKTLLLAERGDVGADIRAIARELAERAIAESAWQLAEITSKLQIDPRLRPVIVTQDDKVPMILVGQRSEPNILAQRPPFEDVLGRPDEPSLLGQGPPFADLLGDPDEPSILEQPRRMGHRPWSEVKRKKGVPGHHEPPPER